MTVTASPVPILNDNYAWLLRESGTGATAIVDPADAHQSDKQPVAEQKTQPAATLRDDQSYRDHRRAEDDRGTNAKTLGRAPHGDATKGGAEPGE